MNSRILMITALLGATACVEPFSTKTEQEASRYVVEGRVTDQGPPNNLTLSRTANYSNNLDGITTFVSGAEVRVCDDQGACIPFYEFSKGHYEPVEGAARGEIGKTYHVEIITDEGTRLFSYPEQMLESPPINKVYYEYNPATLLRDGYTVYIDTNDPEAAHNFYKWETVNYFPYSSLCFNRISITYPPVITSDRNINGNNISRLAVRTVPHDNTTYYVVEVYQLAISGRAYEYLDEIDKQINSTGSIFDPPPSFIRGNLFNPDDPDDVVLGYFLVAGTSRKDVLIKRAGTGVTPYPFSPEHSNPQYCGDPCNMLCVAYTGGKCGEPPCPPECASLPGVTATAPDAWPLPHDPCAY